MHNLSIFAVRRPVTIIVLIIGIILFGAISLNQIGIDLLPDFNFPVAVVVTVYPHAQAEMVEQEITIPVEGVLANVSGIRRMDSFSLENISVQLIQFDWNTDMVEAIDNVRSSLAQAAFNLPEEAQVPVVARYDPNEFPLMIIGVSSNSLTELELSDNLRSIRPMIEQISGVADVGLLGAQDAEIEVLFDPAKLSDVNLTPNLLEQLISYQNMMIPGGSVSDSENRYNLRTGHRFSNAEDLADLVIGKKDDTGILNLGGLLPSIVHLSDVAEINKGIKERDGVTRLNSSDTILIRVMRQSGSNTVQVANDVNETLRQIEQQQPELEFINIIDQSQFILSSVKSLAFNGIVGALFALIVLFIFLRNLHSLIIIGLAIPISIIATFIMVYFGNLTINLMTLGGLALGAGILVDSSIVVLENIYRHRLEGKDRILAAEHGSKEISSAIIASTLTTLAVFLPVIYMQSIAGELFKELGLTVSFSLLASLLIALSVVPMFTARLFKSMDYSKPSYSSTFIRLQTFYSCLLAKSLENKHFIAGIILVTLLISAVALPQLGDEFFPALDEGVIGTQVILPSGIPTEQTRNVLKNIESAILGVPEIEHVAIQAGEQGDRDMISQIYGADMFNAELQIKLAPANKRDRSSSEISKDIRELALENGAIRATILGSSLFGSAANIMTPDLFIEIRGEERETLSNISHQIMDGLHKVSGFAMIQNSETQTVNDLFLKVNPARSILGGLTAGQVGLAVNQATTGIHATDIYLNGKSYPVVLRPNTIQNSFDNLMESTITSPVPINGFGEEPVRLKEVVEPQIEPAPPSIQRTDRRRAINVTAQLGEIDLSTAAREANRILEEISLPPGYTAEIGGLHQLIDESKDDMYLALILAIILVYLVMAAQFESFIQPLCIMCSIPLAMIGAILGLWITGNKLGVVALIGMIILTGIVVNNAIVLVDYINLQRKRGFTVEEAIIKAGKVRLRPILMTAATTVLGLLPLALGIGEGSEFQIPLAVSVIGGLISSTFLTLFVIPVVYMFFAERFHCANNSVYVAATSDEDE